MFGAYIEMHGEPLIAGIEAGMQVAEFKWSGNQELQGTPATYSSFLCPNGTMASWT